jgi:hypothetical protein
MDNSRLEKLEKEIADLKENMSKTSFGKPKKEKKHREPSEYNLFMKEHMAKLKREQGDSYKHQTAFKAAAEAWSASKNKK